MPPGLEIRCLVTQGCGIFAWQDISIAEQLAISGGKIMRIDDMPDIPVVMQRYTMQIEERFVLGPATDEPEDTDFFNHRCDPNAGFQEHIFLGAVRDIRAGPVFFGGAPSGLVTREKDVKYVRDCRVRT